MSYSSLLVYRSNIYSQNGEDGIINEILKRIGKELDKGWCVEFGAWDGIYISNTFALVERKNWNAIYIEGSKERYKDLLVTAKKYKNITPINKFVEQKRNQENSLDNILSQTSLPEDYDLLSIDIDSYDLAILNSYEGKPKIIVIEINSTLRPGILQWHNGVKFIGNSFSSTLSVAKDKGYTLVCHTGNMIFVRNDLISKLNIPEEELQYPERLFFDGWIRKDSLLSRIKGRIIRIFKPLKKIN